MATLTIGGQKIGDYATPEEAQKAYYQWAVDNKANIGGPTGDAPESNQAFIDGARYYTDTSGRGTPQSVESAIFAVQTGKATQEQMDIVAGLTGRPTAASALNPDFTTAGQQASLGVSPFEGGKTVDQYGNAQPMGYNQLPPVPQTGTISSANLSSSTPLNYATQSQTPAYPVGTLGTPGVTSTGQLTLTPEEQKAQAFTTKLQDLNNQLLGQSAYRTEQENAQGLPQLQQTKNDLSNKLTALKNEALAIPLQIQQDATGRGVTDAGVAPHQTALLRNNAIQALSVNALLEAANGNIATALMMVDRAVSQKYDPIKEQIDVAQRNLELILNSPQASIEDKNRALAQQQIQSAKADQLKIDRENFENIQKVALDAAAAGLDTQTLLKIQNAKTQVEAVQIAAAAGLYKTEQAGDQFTLSPGQVRYDSQGNVVAEGQDKPAGTITTAEYNQLVQAGYKGITPLMSQEEAQKAVAAQQRPAAPTGYPTTNLQPGSTDSAAVKQLQTWLVDNGYMSAADMQTGPGIYGPKTTAAVAKVQQQYGVDNTGAVGYWGPKTLAALQGGPPAPLTTTKTSKTSSASAPLYSFKPSTTDISKVQQFAATNPSIDTSKLKTDESYFYWVLSQANTSGGRSE